MQEDGKLHQLKEKWWVEMNPGAGQCDAEASGGGDTPELGMDNVGGVFLVLGSGLIVAIIVGIIDFFWNIRQIAIDETVSIISAPRIMFVMNSFPFYLIIFIFRLHLTKL